MAGRAYPGNTQIQKFLEESYDKERDTRLAWYFKLKGDSNQVTAKSKQYEVFKRKIENAPKPAEDLAAKLPTDSTVQRYNKKITKPDESLLMKASKTKLVAEMRPVTPVTKDKLYDGFTKEGKGRQQYLLQRYQRSPEDKFSFPLLSSWEYGWRLGDVIKKDDIKKPPHGRTRIVAETFYSRTGIPLSSSGNV